MNTRLWTQREKRWLRCALLAAFAVRLALTAATGGYTYDMSCFAAWGDKLAQQGPAAFYADGYFADYPPGYLPVLGAVALLRNGLGLSYESAAAHLLLVLVPSLCDAATAALVFCTARRWAVGEAAARRLTLFAAFCPVLLYDTAIWKQIDGAFALPLVLCFWWMEQKRWAPACLAYGAALAVKPQALLFGPVLAVCFFWLLAEEKTPLGRLKTVGKTAAGAALALAPPLLAGLPFYGFARLAPSLLDKYRSTATGYLYATINAFNWFAALGGNWQAMDAPAIGPLTWQMLGVANLAALTAGLAALAAYSARKKQFSPLLLAAVYGMGVYTFAHCMHERYMVAGVLLVLLAAARWNDRRLFGAGVGFSLIGLNNLAAVYTQVGGSDEWLNSATSVGLTRILGFAETACFLLLLYAALDLVRGGARLPLDAAAPAAPCLPQPVKAVRRAARGAQTDAARGKAAGTGTPPAAPALLAVPAPQPAWTRREAWALAALTALTALFSYAYLGDTTAPQTALETVGAAASEAFLLAGETVPATLWVYPGINENGTLTVVDDDTGNVAASLTLDGGTCFTWISTPFAGTGKSYTATLENGRVIEIALRDAAGSPVAAAGGGALLDEQAAVPGVFSQLNSMYFDEIYHGRTGYEMLHKMTVYETTHPPLGKDFILLGIALFGMTGFGWRFAGVLFGVLLVPLCGCFARRLTRKPWVGLTAACLIALDFMRFSQSRIATIDTCSTFFILLGAYCMLWYAQSVLTRGVCRSLLPMALGGAAFGLGAASKWTGIYAGVGLAVLYFLVLGLRRRQKPARFDREFFTAAWGGVLFFLCIPFLLYLGAYLPYWWRDPAFSLKDWWNCQTYMYWYHSQLKATHPFESYWYTWPLLLRPVWYYMNTNLPAGSYGSIAGMGGPVLWLGGFAAVLTLFWRRLTGRGTRAGACVLILYASQLLPWMLVTRDTFAYHYFPSSMFGLAALALLLGDARQEKRAKKAAAALCAASLVLMVWFYPALSGLPVPYAWAKSLLRLPSWGFYIL